MKMSRTIKDCFAFAKNERKRENEDISIQASEIQQKDLLWKLKMRKNQLMRMIRPK